MLKAKTPTSRVRASSKEPAAGKSSKPRVPGRSNLHLRALIEKEKSRTDELTASQDSTVSCRDGKLIIEHEGTLERFTGDGMMIFFNDSVRCRVPPNGRSRWLSNKTAVEELITKWRKFGYDLDCGIGIAQGYAAIGTIGFEGRWDYGASARLPISLCGSAVRRSRDRCPILKLLLARQRVL